MAEKGQMMYCNESSTKQTLFVKWVFFRNAAIHLQKGISTVIPVNTCLPWNIPSSEEQEERAL